MDPGLWQTPSGGSTQLHQPGAQLHRARLKGKEQSALKPSPPATEETGRGQATSPSPEEKEWSCPSPGADPHPPS